LHCLSSRSQSQSSTPAWLQSSFCHFRPTLHGPSRPQKRNIFGNPAPELPRKHLAGFSWWSFKNPVSFPSTAHSRRGGGLSKIRKALSCLPPASHFPFAYSERIGNSRNYLQCAGINRHEVGNERVLRGRSSDPLRP
jgi:hypothetical protein